MSEWREEVQNRNDEGPSLLVPDYLCTFIKEGGIIERYYTISILVYVKDGGFVVKIYA